MDGNDLIQFIINFSQSLGPVQYLILGMSYLLGIIFVILGISKLYSLASMPLGGGAEHTFTPLAYIVGGCILLYAPSAFRVLTTTVFGEGSVLQYASLNPVDIMSSMFLLIQTAGLIWFIRGCVLLVGSSQPGVQEGPKGIVFICAGILAMNFETTIAVMNTLMTEMATIL